MLSFDAAGFERQMQDAVRDIERAIEEAAQVGEEAVAQATLEAKQEEVEKTYARPAPPGTQRTGAWREGQQLTGESGELHVETVGPAAVYEGSLATLSSDRRNPAAENARARMEEEAPRVFEEAVERALDGFLR